MHQVPLAYREPRTRALRSGAEDFAEWATAAPLGDIQILEKRRRGDFG